MRPKDADEMANSVDPVKEQSDLGQQACLSENLGSLLFLFSFEPRHDKTNKISMRPAKTQISQGICPV